MNQTKWFIENADKVGVVALLLIAVFWLVYALRLMYKRSSDCEASRLEDANERANLKQSLGRLEGKVETMEESLSLLHKQTLEFVVKNNNKE